MRQRAISSQLIAALEDTPVVFLQGPRQAGKTTLVRELSRHGWDGEYKTLDDAGVLALAQQDPDGFIAGLPDRVILDEVQRAPELFRAIKLSVDRNRRPGRFLLTGSANALLLPKVADSLAGRMEILTLLPFSQNEIEGLADRAEGSAFLDLLFGDSFEPRPLAAESWPSVARRIVRGGFPEALSRKDDERRDAWYSSYTTTILERDIRDLTNIQSHRELPRLLRLIALRSGSLLNQSDVAREAGLPHTSLQRYWSLLEAVFFVRTLQAWSGNLGLRLVKSPKVVLNDTGLLCHLIGLDPARLIKDDLAAGPVLETFVATELLKQTATSRTRASLYHYRTHKQQEVDLLLEDPRGQLVAIEVKKTASPTGSDLDGIRKMRAAVGDRFLRGVLLYLGSEWIAADPSLHLVPIPALWQVRPNPAREKA